jgi:PAS domain S-box-containing protein/putative nucleotidyltransferase with HDIG domain
MSLVGDLEIVHADWIPALVEHSPNLVVVVDGTGAVIFANPTALAMFGVSAEGSIGRSAFRFIHPKDLYRLEARFAELLRRPGTSTTDTIRFVCPNGGTRVLEIVATNLLADEVVSGIVINGHDVTERDNYLASLEATLDAVTESVANMVEFRDPYTAGHQRQVARIAVAVARDLGLPDDEVQGIEVAATLHDIGKIAVPAEILVRPGRLSPAEFGIVKTHCQAGHDILAKVPFPQPVAEMILQHHERLDGSGYPQGLAGEDILMGSRIVSVADVLSAMASHRPYRPALGISAALDELRANSGRLYDKDAVHSVMRVVGSQDFQLAGQFASTAGSPRT